MKATRGTGLRVEYLDGGNNRPYHIAGLVTISPHFHTRAEAEDWLREHSATLPPSRQPRDRACMRCGDTFRSEGFHNRLCADCRMIAADDALPTITLAAGTGKIRRVARG